MGNIKFTDAQAEVTEVSLLEYDNKQGMLLHTELSRKRIKSVKRFIRVNHNEVVVVLRVDEKKGYIDLSKKKAREEDIAECKERYQKAKVVHSILKKVALERKMVLEELYELVGWPFYDLYGHCYDAFKLCTSTSAFTSSSSSSSPSLPVSSSSTSLDPFDHLTPPIDLDLKQDILKFIRKRMAPRPTRLRADIEITCPTMEGIEAIKEALYYGIYGKEYGGKNSNLNLNERNESNHNSDNNNNGNNSSNSSSRNRSGNNGEDVEGGQKNKRDAEIDKEKGIEEEREEEIFGDGKIEIELIASPLYSLQIASLDIEKSMIDLRQAIERVRERIVEKGGNLFIKLEPKIVSTRDELEYKQLLEKVNLEMSGDDYEEEDDDGEDI